MHRNQKFVVLGLLSTAAMLLAALLVLYQREDALAQDQAAPTGPPSMVAATGACGIGSEIGVLYVIDTEKKQLAVYAAFQGRAVEFVAARKIFYDLELLTWNDESPGHVNVKALKNAFEEHTKKKEGAKAEEPRRR